MYDQITKEKCLQNQRFVASENCRREKDNIDHLNDGAKEEISWYRDGVHPIHLA